jgi:hypothetical protein
MMNAMSRKHQGKPYDVRSRSDINFGKVTQSAAAPYLETTRILFGRF